MTADQPIAKRLRVRIRPSRARFHAQPLRVPAANVRPVDFTDLTGLIRELWGRATYNEHAQMLRALEAACHQLSAS